MTQNEIPIGKAATAQREAAWHAGLTRKHWREIGRAHV